jgi:CheY-like chemotaxis protein
LVVDDEPMVRKTVAALLQAMGHDVIEAAEGAAAVRLAVEAAPDVVVTDLGMPEMNGRELARAVKSANPRLPVVLLTGWQEATPGPETQSDPVDRILGKPVRLDALRRVIAELTTTPASFPS